MELIIRVFIRLKFIVKLMLAKPILIAAAPILLIIVKVVYFTNWLLFIFFFLGMVVDQIFKKEINTGGVVGWYPNFNSDNWLKTISQYFILKRPQYRSVISFLILKNFKTGQKNWIQSFKKIFPIILWRVWNFFTSLPQNVLKDWEKLIIMFNSCLAYGFWGASRNLLNEFKQWVLDDWSNQMLIIGKFVKIPDATAVGLDYKYVGIITVEGWDNIFSNIIFESLKNKRVVTLITNYMPSFSKKEVNHFIQNNDGVLLYYQVHTIDTLFTLVISENHSTPLQLKQTTLFKEADFNQKITSIINYLSHQKWQKINFLENICLFREDFLIVWEHFLIILGGGVETHLPPTWSMLQIGGKDLTTNTTTQLYDEKFIYWCEKGWESQPNMFKRPYEISSKFFEWLESEHDQKLK